MEQNGYVVLFAEIKPVIKSERIRNPILIQYKQEVNIPNYAHRINVMLNELKQKYRYSEQDVMMVLKDFLYRTGKTN